MGTVTKVLSVFMFVLSMIYCGITVTLFMHKVNWKEKALTLEKEKQELENTYTTEKQKLEDIIEKLKAEKDRLENDYKDLNDKYKNTLANITSLKKELTRKEGQIEVLQTRLLDKDEVIKKKDQEISELHQKNESIRERIEEYTEDIKRYKERLEGLEEENKTLALKIKVLKGELENTKKELETKKSIIAQLIEQGIPVNEIVVSGGPEKPIKGKVLAVKDDVGLVMLNVGKEEGVKKGYRFVVYRDDKYIGKVEVETVFSDMSSARILKEFTKDVIKEGDNVSTRVY